MFGLCDKLDMGKTLAGLGSGPRDFRRRPAGTVGVAAQAVQYFEVPPFLPMLSSS